MINFSENSLIEQPTIDLFKSLGWNTIDCFTEFEQIGGSPLVRETKSEVVLLSRLRPALEKLNPYLPPEVFEQAIEELTRDRSAMSLANANREIYNLVKNGIKVKLTNPEGGGETLEIVKVIDWDNPEENDFLLASQFWVTGEMYTRRADLVGFVNGIPIVFIELKAAHKRLENAYSGNLSDYKDTIPHLFWYNSFIILSNGSRSKIGSVSASWEHFSDWKKINSEGEKGIISLETMIRGTCEPARLLELVENFSIFMESKGGLIKLISKNHQYLGVNNAIEALKEIESRKGRLGVFWHTQGSGKSISMIFFSQKILRKIPGNWTFVIVTDRKELDDQIYENFVDAGVVTEGRAQATSSFHLRQLLREDHRYVFTIIYKFRTEGGEKHPVLSERSDIIVITDEAHRSQYDTLALNMRTALPNASFIAFTGTPLIVGEEKTRNVFGDYVSVYNFKQSVDDKATVPLFYENRIPELQLTNENLNENMERLLEEAELDTEQETKLEREFAREYHLITRDDRLETIAEDIVNHFINRGYQGKAMIVCIDKATAVRMYDKVQKYWKQYIRSLNEKLIEVNEQNKDEMFTKLQYMKKTEMAVVVSQSQNEIEEMRKKGLDISVHRKRMFTEDLDSKFKDPDDHFRIVFVCAMWMTGFDVPCCSTIYLDKPMRNHTLMQTIARANRVFKDKINGLIVDYVGVFRNLQKALAIYGSGTDGSLEPGDTPVLDKSILVNYLKNAVAEISTFCKALGIKLNAIHSSEGYKRVELLDNAMDAILVDDESKKRYLSLENTVSRLYKAVLPDPVANELSSNCIIFKVIADKIRSLILPIDISEVMGSVEKLLDESIASEGYIISALKSSYNKDRIIDLSKIDFEALKEKFNKGRKNIEIEKLKNIINRKLMMLVRLNRTRMDYLKHFQEMIEEYNTGSLNINEFFKQLIDFSQSLDKEDKRSIAEQLSEEELAVFDLLTKPEIKLTNKEIKEVKKTARELLEVLKREKLILDWRKHQQSRAQVRVTIEEIFDTNLPRIYIPELFKKKCDVVFQHIYDSYFGSGKSIYATAI